MRASRTTGWEGVLAKKREYGVCVGEFSTGGIRSVRCWGMASEVWATEQRLNLLRLKTESKERTEPVSRTQTLKAGRLTDEKEDPKITHAQSFTFTH